MLRFEVKGRFLAAALPGFTMIAVAQSLKWLNRNPLTPRDGFQPHKGTKGETSMERLSQEELKAHLMETDEEFRRLAMAHSEYARKIEAIESLPHPSPEQQLEEIKLKKLKLHAKDLMAQIMSRHMAGAH